MSERPPFHVSALHHDAGATSPVPAWYIEDALAAAQALLADANTVSVTIRHTDRVQPGLGPAAAGWRQGG